MIHVLDQLNIERCHLIGHSMGGMIGILMLEKLQSRALSIVNMEANMTAKDSGASLTVVTQSLEEFSSGGYDAFKETVAESHEKGSEKRLQWLSLIPDFVFYKSAKSITQWANSEKILKFFLSAPQKKLFVYGDKNRDKAARLPDTIEKAEIPHAGHRMLADNVEETRRVIENFYREIAL